MNNLNPRQKKALIAVVAALAAAGIVFAIFAGNKQAKPSAQQQTEAPKVSQEAKYTVPNVVSLTQADAEKAIVASGLKVGKVDKQASDKVPQGSVISQDPAALTNAKVGSVVNLVVSTGKADKKDVKVPDLKGKTQADAEKALKDVGLVGVATQPEETKDVAPGQVFKQSVKAGETVKEGTQVSFTVALAPSESTVPNVVGMTRDEAQKAIQDANLGFDTTTAYDNKVAEGRVISQSVAAGSKVKAGSNVTIAISLGTKPADEVTVPDVMTYTWPDAEAAMTSAGLAVRYTGDPSGTVVAQDIAAGTKVAPNTLVTLTLSTPVRMVTVPNVIGQSVESAGEAATAAGLGYEASSSHGTVEQQWPEAGTQVEAGTTMSVTIDDSEYRGDGKTAEDFIGSWACDRASIDISNADNGLNVQITWGNSASESLEWNYNCNMQGENLVSDGNGTKSTVTTNDDGSQDVEVNYSDGSATFSIDGSGKLAWKDNKEGAGNGMAFTRF